MDTPRDEAQEALLRDIIAEGSDALSMFLVFVLFSSPPDEVRK